MRTRIRIHIARVMYTHVQYILCGRDKIEKELAQSRVAITTVVDRPVAATVDRFYLYLVFSILLTEKLLVTLKL